jgi:uncharacterized delta-60 repeat protein
MVRSNVFACIAVAIASAIVTACTGNDPLITGAGNGDGGSSGTEGGTTSGSFKLKAPTPVVLGPSESVKIPIEIERINGFIATVKVVVQPVPDGTAAGPLTLEAGATKGELTVVATPTVAQANVTLQIVATAEPALSDSKELPLIIRGKPGDRDVTFGDRDGATLIGAIVPRALARMADDGIAILGEGSDYRVARVLPTGKIDTVFGSKGVTSLASSVGGFYPYLRVAKDGKILAAGRSEDRKKAFIHRLLPSGAYDTDFGTGGIATVSLENGFFGIAVDDLGGVVIGSFPAKFRRLMPDGTPDATFDAKNLSTSAQGWQQLLLRADGTPIALGFKSGSTPSIGLSIVTGTASPFIDHGGSWSTVNVESALIDTKGRFILVGGGTTTNAPSEAFFHRALASGEFDVVFGGPVLETFGPVGESSSFHTVLEEPSGKILCVGQHQKSNTDVRAILVRYDDAGKRDLSFGTEGVVQDTAAPGTFQGGAALQTSLPTVVVARRYEPASTVLLRYWR